MSTPTPTPVDIPIATITHTPTPSNIVSVFVARNDTSVAAVYEVPQGQTSYLVLSMATQVAINNEINIWANPLMHVVKDQMPVLISQVAEHKMPRVYPTSVVCSDIKDVTNEVPYRLLKELKRKHRQHDVVYVLKNTHFAFFSSCSEKDWTLPHLYTLEPVEGYNIYSLGASPISIPRVSQRIRYITYGNRSINNTSKKRLDVENEALVMTHWECKAPTVPITIRIDPPIVPVDDRWECKLCTKKHPEGTPCYVINTNDLICSTCAQHVETPCMFYPIGFESVAK